MGEHDVARRSAVFLDRDGVLNHSFVREGRPYPPAKVEDFVLYHDLPAGCARLEAAGFLLVVVTNQPDVARGTQSRATVDAMHAKMAGALPQVVRTEVCWHAGTEWADPCECHKPAPGLVLRAANALQVDLTTSFLIGDRWRDVDCGHRAGCRTIFIDRGYVEPLRQLPDWRVNSFTEAVDTILYHYCASALARRQVTCKPPRTTA